MTTTSAPAAGLGTAPATPRRAVFALFLLLFRLLATAHAGLCLLQPVSIGQYLDGRYGLLRVHQVGAGLLVLTALALGVVALGYVLSGGRTWALVCGLLFLLEGVQTGLGYSRSLGLHVPLGVAVVVLALVLAVLVWTPAAARCRPPRHRAPVEGPA
ncbi:MAG: hypothetical protein AVDCRST_MAG48-1046 [uncultured Friedmanniella sp.]|uniref:Uncharacterized protein n=1 Tax=uncultured Friedmanniella sp. TaxID=335381 RepID=A0A6J4K7F1_9ACTN|nr:MAG: hypothetical protein AVDCRST_MAG48-1046 [uncultured Friedmanniella sp.]